MRITRALPVRALLVTGDREDAVRLRETLARGGGGPVVVIHVARLTEAVRMAEDEQFDVVLLDLSLPEAQGLAGFRRLSTHAPETPIICLMPVADDTLGLAAIEAGAQDCVPKGEADERTLHRSIRFAIERNRLMYEVRARALTDPLTGLSNRRGFLALAEHQVRMALRSRREMHLLCADVDDLQAINDAFGHESGDQALCEAAEVFRSTFRDADILARIGGDELAALALETSGAGSAEILTRRLEVRLDEFNQRSGRPYRLSMSIGTARFDPEAPSSLEELLEQADAVAFERKREKRIASESA